MQDFIHRHPNLLALAVLSLIAYANALPNSFQFDDYVTIVENRPIQDLRKFPSYFTDPRIFSGAKIDWRPVLQVTYAVDYAIGGANPTPNLALFHSGGSVRRPHGQFRDGHFRFARFFAAEPRRLWKRQLMASSGTARKSPTRKNHETPSE